jgi:hypothetical protein
MSAKIQTHLLSTKRLVLVDSFFSKLNTTSLGPRYREAFTLMVECERLGFSFEPQLLNIVSHGTTTEMKNFWEWFKTEQAQIFKTYKPMYPNFPQQVMEASDAELLFNAVMHYTGDWFGLRILPHYEKKMRQLLQEKTEPMRLGAISQDELPSLFSQLITANTSLSESNKQMMTLLFETLAAKNAADMEKFLASQVIPQKETLAYLGALVLQSSIDFNTTLSPQIKTPTDLLRLSAALNQGDVSLAEDTPIIKMSRPIRKAFVAKLETLFQTTGDPAQLMENLFTYKEQWTRLAHAMHVGEYQQKCPLAFAALQKVRENNKDESLLSKADKLMKSGKPLDAANLLSKRPGVFCRSLNQLLLNGKKDIPAIVSLFKTVASDVSTPVLLQTLAKFKYDYASKKHIVLPKGGLGKIFVKHHDKQTLGLADASLVSSVIEDTLVERFKKGPSLGRVYIQDELMLQHVPFAQRSVSKALKTVAKGSRFVRESDKPALRFFTWWNESGVNSAGKPTSVGRIDIDLSVGIFDKEYQLIQQCAYYDLLSMGMTHSGDITSAPHGAAEYIDVDVEKLIQHTPRAAFVGQLISSFTSQKYSEIPECFAGWMEREQPTSGEIFEPSTVKNKIDITSESTQVLTFLYDINRKEYIWADLPLANTAGRLNLFSVRHNLAYAIEGLAEMKKANLHDLFSLHAKARGALVSSREEADTVFSINEGITPYDFEKIASEFMADSYVQAPTPGLRIK